jgi:hypothetical protein
MSSRFWIGLGRHMIPLPRFVWERRVRKSARATAAHLEFMTEEHHLVREFTVRELARIAKALAPEAIAAALGLPVDRVEAILDDLEKNLTFVCRNAQGEVAWAYPVTVEGTPHHVTFSSGERLYAA